VEAQTSRLPHFLDNRHTDGDELVGLTRRKPFALRKIQGSKYVLCMGNMRGFLMLEHVAHITTAVIYRVKNAVNRSGNSTPSEWKSVWKKAAIGLLSWYFCGARGGQEDRDPNPRSPEYETGVLASGHHGWLFSTLMIVVVVIVMIYVWKWWYCWLWLTWN
jgi:hypothetical protein